MNATVTGDGEHAPGDVIAKRLADEARALDARDPLARWRDRFVVSDPELAYLDGNSLGMTPRATLDRLRHVVEHEWAGGLIGSWEHWIDLPQAVGDELAPLIGARPGEVVVHDSVSVNLYQLVHAAVALRPERSVIAVDRTDFPTDRYLVDAVAAATGRSVHRDLDESMPWPDVAVVVRSHVDYRTAEVADLSAETAKARGAGALTIWDLSHSAGVLAFDVHAAGVELAVGCTYKYLNGGPGAPGFSFVTRELITSIDQPIHGWHGHRDVFRMADRYEPRDDIGRLRIGTPGILGLTAARTGIGMTSDAGIDLVDAKARDLTEFALRCCDELGLESPTPRDRNRRGGHVSIRHPDADAVTRDLAEHWRVVADFRHPDLIRLGCSPLTTRFRDVVAGTVAIALAPLGRD